MSLLTPRYVLDHGCHACRCRHGGVLAAIAGVLVRPKEPQRVREIEIQTASSFSLKNNVEYYGRDERGLQAYVRNTVPNSSLLPPRLDLITKAGIEEVE